jgi:hypothetical protein
MNHLVHRQCSSIVEKESKLAQNGNYESKQREEGRQSSSTKSRQKGFVAATSPRLLSVPRSSQHSLGTTAGYLITIVMTWREVIHGELLFQYGRLAATSCPLGHNPCWFLSSGLVRPLPGHVKYRLMIGQLW